MRRATICPRCFEEYTNPPALSRADNATDICSKCGTVEALECLTMAMAGATRSDIQSVLAVRLHIASAMPAGEGHYCAYEEWEGCN